MQTRISSTISLVAGLAFAILVTLFFSAVIGCDSQQKATEASDVPGQSDAQFQTATSIAASTPATPNADVGSPIPETESTSERLAQRVVTYEEAEAAYRERDYRMATDLFSAYTVQKTENPWGYYMLGLSAWKNASYEQAEQAFTKALELAPDHVKSLLNLSRVFLDTERPGEALERIEVAMSIDSTFGVTYRLRGRALHELGRLVAAEDAYREAIRIDNRDAWSMNNLGLVLMEQDFHTLAIPPLARATELRNDVPLFFNNLGMALEQSEYYRAAEAAYRHAVSIDAGFDKAVANLARIEAVEQDSVSGSLDLTQYARDFEAEIVSWSDEAVSREEPIAEGENAVLESVIDEESIVLEVDKPMEPETDPPAKLDADAESEIDDLDESGAEAVDAVDAVSTDETHSSPTEPVLE